MYWLYWLIFRVAQSIECRAVIVRDWAQSRKMAMIREVPERSW